MRALQGIHAIKLCGLKASTNMRNKYSQAWLCVCILSCHINIIVIASLVPHPRITCLPAHTHPSVHQHPLPETVTLTSPLVTVVTRIWWTWVCTTSMPHIVGSRYAFWNWFIYVCDAKPCAGVPHNRRLDVLPSLSRQIEGTGRVRTPC